MQHKLITMKINIIQSIIDSEPNIIQFEGTIEELIKLEKIESRFGQALDKILKNIK